MFLHHWPSSKEYISFRVAGRCFNTLSIAYSLLGRRDSEITCPQRGGGTRSLPCTRRNPESNGCRSSRCSCCEIPSCQHRRDRSGTLGQSKDNRGCHIPLRCTDGQRIIDDVDMPAGLQPAGLGDYLPPNEEAGRECLPASEEAGILRITCPPTRRRDANAYLPPKRRESSGLPASLARESNIVAHPVLLP
jgi:hypothetical protein